jgi:hypothetical protein
VIKKWGFDGRDIYRKHEENINTSSIHNLHEDRHYHAPDWQRSNVTIKLQNVKVITVLLQTAVSLNISNLASSEFFIRKPY